MEKILLAIDGTNLKPQSLSFACYLANLEDAAITGVFLENLVVNEHPELKEAFSVAYLTWTVDKESDVYKNKMATIDNNITLFKNACEKKAVRFSVKKEEGEPSAEIARDSRYADVIITDADAFFDKQVEGMPTGFLKEVLKNAECPVIIAPESFNGIEEIIFAYDGSKSSMHAIKQFTYLFPRLEDVRITVLEVNDTGQLYAPEKQQLQDWLSGHYSDVHFEIIRGDTESELFAQLLKKKNVFVVMGAYGRSSLSRFFKHSHADLLIKTITQAIFIAHS